MLACEKAVSGTNHSKVTGKSVFQNVGFNAEENQKSVGLKKKKFRVKTMWMKKARSVGKFRTP